MSRTSGFTLLEMLVVLAVMGLVAAAAPLADYTLLDRVRVTFAVRSVTARIYKAEAAALAQNAAIALTPAALQGGLIVAVRLAGYSDVQAPARLWFYPDGSATGGAILLGAGRSARTLTINALDGHVDQGG